ncbi:hypothetical protein M1146_01320 [Patescibacteria group bacterium]|nr:hypothetical protein [Patescibacteria group bacterium]
MKKYLLIISIVLLFAFSVSTVEARRTSFKTKSYAPKIYTPRNYKNGGQLRMQRGYLKRNGTYVQPHLKTKPDNTIYNNRKYIFGF